MIFLLFSSLFGLMAFIQPCTLAVNNIFLAYLLKENYFNRVLESFKFTAVRILFFCILGMVVSLAGSFLLDFRYFVKMIVVLIHLILGVMMIAGRFRPMPVPNLNFSWILPRKKSPGVAFALGIPACGVPLLLAILALALLRSSPGIGFLYLFLFVLTFSSPMIIISSLSKASAAMRYLFKLAVLSPYFGGLSLLGVGIYLLFQ